MEQAPSHRQRPSQKYVCEYGVPFQMDWLQPCQKTGQPRFENSQRLPGGSRGSVSMGSLFPARNRPAQTLPLREAERLDYTYCYQFRDMRPEPAASAAETPLRLTPILRAPMFLAPAPSQNGPLWLMPYPTAERLGGIHFRHRQAGLRHFIRPSTPCSRHRPPLCLRLRVLTWGPHGQ